MAPSGGLCKPTGTARQGSGPHVPAPFPTPGWSRREGCWKRRWHHKEAVASGDTSTATSSTAQDPATRQHWHAGLGRYPWQGPGVLAPSQPLPRLGLLPTHETKCQDSQGVGGFK